MGDCFIRNSESDEEEKLAAAADFILGVVRSKKNLSNNVQKILADLSVELSIFSIPEDQSTRISEIETRVNVIQERIMIWEEDQSIIDSGPDESAYYFNAVDEGRELADTLETLCSGKDGVGCQLLRRVHEILQTAMERLGEEFSSTLIQNMQNFEPEHMSFRSSEDDGMDEGSIVSGSNESLESSLRRSGSRMSEDYVYDSVLPDVIPVLKRIANLMFNSHYEQECSLVYINVRKDALDDGLCFFELGKHSIEDVLKMDRHSLNSKIKRWIQAMKIFMRVHLFGEKCLCDQIFGEHGSASSTIFVEVSKPFMMQLLNFGQAVSIGPHQPEKLFGILDMYELLADLLLDIDTLYSDPAGSAIKTESHALLRSLGDSATKTFLNFRNAIASDVATQPTAGGNIHRITNYVMNYLRNLIIDYNETLDILLKGHEVEDSSFLLLEMSQDLDDENTSEDSLSNRTPMSLHFQLVTSVLESNLYRKSHLYKDPSLQHLFLMNNMQYMAQKVMKSELRHTFGDDWIRKHKGKVQHHAREHERAAWNSILTLLKDEGLRHPGSSSISKTLLKERLHNFYLAFDDIYRTLSGWQVPDARLREDLIISASVKVVQAYRTFVGRYSNQISEKHIKYSAEDLERFLLDLFNGSSKSLNSSHRR